MQRVMILVIAAAACAAPGCGRQQPAAQVQEREAIALAAEADEGQLIKVLVAKEDIEQWTPLRAPASFFVVKGVARKDVPPTFVPPELVKVLADRPVIKLLRKGEILTWEDVQDRNKAGLEAILSRGKRGFSIKATPATAAGGFILPGARVDVLATGPNARYLLESILVRAVNQQAHRDGNRAGVDCRNITLELTPEEALKLSTKTDHVALSLRPQGGDQGVKDPDLPPPPPPPRPDVPLPGVDENALEVMNVDRGTVVLVARGNLERWTGIRKPAAMFVTKEIPSEEAPKNYVPAAAINELLDRVLLFDMRKGSVITWRHLQPKSATNPEVLLEPGRRLFAVKATPETAGCCLPGSHVDVILVTKTKKGFNEARYILEDVLVRGVDQHAWRPDDGRIPDFSTVSLDLSPTQVLKLAHMSSKGTIRLVVRPFGDNTKTTDE